jgi:VWFA-related protein
VRRSPVSARLARLAALALAGAWAGRLAAASAQQAPAPPPVFPVDVALVRVEVLVTEKGQPVRGLQAGDFELRDDGRAQALEPVVEERVPVDAVLVLDMSYSVSGRKLAALRDAAGAFLDGLADDETAALVTFQEKTTLAEPPTADRARVRRALAAARPRGSTALRDAVYAALRVRETGTTRRTAVVVFSDGLDNLSWLPADSVVEAARRSDVVVYAVAVLGERERGNSFLRDVTAATGGRMWTVRDAGDLRARFLDVLEDIRARYVLSFAPSATGPAGWHALQVRLKGRRGDVLARPGYWSAGR